MRDYMLKDFKAFLAELKFHCLHGYVLCDMMRCHA